MKITRRQLNRIVAEAVETLLKENYPGDALPGDYLEVVISDDGYDISVRKINPADFQNSKSPYASLKALVKVEQVAATSEDY